ncbi:MULTISPECIES: TauD/TfdA family dioxygenase [unclassified Streptomyces]|uniref:TauD/TfdA dioxygenase family protein n=1 Tax=unclassified Streptomyces TaxID=2593676 RepID=UPI00278BD823|nr:MULTISPECIES: TauD/TfdA family dioxygenase [unclassified Streptomyces]
MSVTVTELTPTTGVQITGLAGDRLVDKAVAEECRAALDRRGVVVYREAHLNDADLVAFSRLLGQVLPLPNGGVPGHPEVQAITRDPSKSRLAAYREATFFWHIDGTTSEVPDKATLLTARRVDGGGGGGGDTEFANTYAAYEALTQEERADLEDVRVVHSFAASQLHVTPNPSPKERAAWDRNPAREHPLVWTHQDGRRSMLLGTTAGAVVGRPQEEGKALLSRLLDWTTQPRFTLRHQWHQGDLVIWDNTGMLHRALPYEQSSSRLMHRTSLAGEEAIA